MRNLSLVIFFFLFAPQPSLDKTAPEMSLTRIRVTVVGDIMVHGPQLSAALTPDSTYDFLSSFKKIEPWLSSADLTIGNLETVFAGPEWGYKGYPTFNTPDTLAFTLKEMGFDLIKVANNHAFDHGRSGFYRTLDVLQKNGLESIGGHRRGRETCTLIKSIKGINIGFMAFTYGSNGDPFTSGGHYIHILDTVVIQSQLEQLSSSNPDLVIALVHWGDEYSQTPNTAQRKMASWMINHGIDIVIGDHPHVIQPIEVIQATDGRVGIVAYSLGNFISSQRSWPRSIGGLLDIEIEKSWNMDTTRVSWYRLQHVETVIESGNYSVVMK